MSAAQAILRLLLAALGLAALVFAVLLLLEAVALDSGVKSDWRDAAFAAPFALVAAVCIGSAVAGLESTRRRLLATLAVALGCAFAVAVYKMFAEH